MLFLPLLPNRHKALQALLWATPADMHRICRSYTSLLARDINQISSNLTSLAQHLQVPLVRVQADRKADIVLLGCNS